jgi:hypothetical protein
MKRVFVFEDIEELTAEMLKLTGGVEVEHGWICSADPTDMSNVEVLYKDGTTDVGWFAFGEWSTSLGNGGPASEWPVYKGVIYGWKPIHKKTKSK